MVAEWPAFQQAPDYQQWIYLGEVKAQGQPPRMVVARVHSCFGEGRNDVLEVQPEAMTRILLLNSIGEVRPLSNPTRLVGDTSRFLQDHLYFAQLHYNEYAAEQRSSPIQFS